MMQVTYSYKHAHTYVHVLLVQYMYMYYWCNLTVINLELVLYCLRIDFLISVLIVAIQNLFICSFIYKFYEVQVYVF